MIALLAFLETNRLVHLAPVDLVIIAFYFALVLGIGFYLKRTPIPARISSWPAAR